ncbi:hypothetical protein [Nocardioides sp.]|uniref:hypothetical protein n=1 Tax=Nocardioides sp. TaxID=35761 RepID=UPI0027338463|nr:hypothetical protein [Nocardioides sp.]MDP3894448.1 hypothetical protein [Nocardioides sp.]
MTTHTDEHPTGHPTGHPSDYAAKQVVDWTDLGREMWSFLTGRRARVNYTFVDMCVEVPRDTGPQAPRATWKLSGTLQVSVEDTGDAASAPRAPAA